MEKKTRKGSFSRLENFEGVLQQRRRRRGEMGTNFRTEGERSRTERCTIAERLGVTSPGKEPSGRGGVSTLGTEKNGITSREMGGGHTSRRMVKNP